MVFHESETVELKNKIVDDIKKEIVAFANCEGGKIYIGVGDDGTVTGLEDPDGTALRVSNMVRDAIKPDLTMFLHYETLELEGKYIVAVDIQRGTDRPYYLARKGLRPEGVYVRQGYSSVPATDTAIRQMIKETDGDRFEEMRSLEQDLTFESAAKEFQHRNIDFGPKQMQSLRMINNDGIFTNLGLLLSDQCVHTIKIAVFQGDDQSVFTDRREFSGSLMKQLNDIYKYIDMHNNTYATYDKLLRIDTRDYPEMAVREALLNVLVHRDYAFRASALISIYSDRIEFVSVGGLLPGIELEDIMMGLSVCRNQNLANVFYRLKLIEAYGTGIRKILKAYAEHEQKPVIHNTNNAFKIVLPNMNIGPENKNVTGQQETIPLNDKEKTVLDYVRRHNAITRPEAEKLLQTSSSSALRILRSLTQKGKLIHHGKGRSVVYIAK